MFEDARQVPIVSVLERMGIQVRKSGGNFVALCPLHAEKTPSFTIFPDNRYHCFGCGSGGDVIDLTMKLRGVGFIAAVEILSGRRPGPAPTTSAEERRCANEQRFEEMALYLYGITQTISSFRDEMLSEEGPSEEVREAFWKLVERRIEVIESLRSFFDSDEFLSFGDFFDAVNSGRVPPQKDYQLLAHCFRRHSGSRGKRTSAIEDVARYARRVFLSEAGAVRAAHWAIAIELVSGPRASGEWLEGVRPLTKAERGFLSFVTEMIERRMPLRRAMELENSVLAQLENLAVRDASAQSDERAGVAGEAA